MASKSASARAAPKKNGKKKKESSSVSSESLREEARRPPRADFVNDVAACSGIDRAEVQKTLEAIHKVVVRQLLEDKSSRLPTLLRLRLKILPERAAFTRMAFGKEVQVRGREKPLKKVLLGAMRPLNEAALA